MIENFTGGTDKSKLKPESKINWHERWWPQVVLGYKRWSMIKGNLKSLKNTVSFLKLKFCSIKLNVSVQSHRLRRNRKEYSVEDAYHKVHDVQTKGTLKWSAACNKDKAQQHRTTYDLFVDTSTYFSTWKYRFRNQRDARTHMVYVRWTGRSKTQLLNCHTNVNLWTATWLATQYFIRHYAIFSVLYIRICSYRSMNGINNSCRSSGYNGSCFGAKLSHVK